MLGRTVRDKITGFEGVVTGQATYLSGCNRSLVVPKAKDSGEYVAGEWMDDQLLEVVDPNADPIVLDNADGAGPDLAPPK